MTPSTEKFRQQLQKELGLTIGPKDPLLAQWLVHQEFKEELAAEHQRMLVAFEEALTKNQTNWSDSAKNLANQSLNAGLRAARENAALVADEAARGQASQVRTALSQGLDRLEQSVAAWRRLAWISLGSSIIALLAAAILLIERFLR